MADPVRDFALDDDGDIATAGGDFSTVSGAAAVAQAVKIKVKMFLGEVWCDQDLGIDYLNQILKKGPDPIVVRQLIQDQILTVPDVTQVVGADLVINADRTASIRYQIRTVYSTTPITDSVSVP